MKLPPMYSIVVLKRKTIVISNFHLNVKKKPASVDIELQDSALIYMFNFNKLLQLLLFFM